MTQYIRNKTPPMRDMMDCLHLPHVLHRYEHVFLMVQTTEVKHLSPRLDFVGSDLICCTHLSCDVSPAYHDISVSDSVETPKICMIDSSRWMFHGIQTWQLSLLCLHRFLAVPCIGL